MRGKKTSERGVPGGPTEHKPVRRFVWRLEERLLRYSLLMLWIRINWVSSDRTAIGDGAERRTNAIRSSDRNAGSIPATADRPPLFGCSPPSAFVSIVLPLWVLSFSFSLPLPAFRGSFLVSLLLVTKRLSTLLHVWGSTRNSEDYASNVRFLHAGKTPPTSRVALTPQYQKSPKGSSSDMLDFGMGVAQGLSRAPAFGAQ